MKNLLLIILISSSIATFANNISNVSKLALDKNVEQVSSVAFSFNTKTVATKTTANNRVDIIRQASIESTSRKEVMSLSNNSLK